MEPDEHDIELKFDGPPVKQLGGAPADAVINALTAIQRIVHLIGMKKEGRVLKQRAKPSAKVRQDYAVICKSVRVGSHVQPFDIASGGGEATAAAAFARKNLLEMLDAFNSGEADRVERVIPNARERCFIAEAASGLVPSAESGVQVTIWPSSDGAYTSKADKARLLIERYRSGSPPEAEARRITGRVTGVDFDKYSITLRPVGARAFRFACPTAIEELLQANRRKRIAIVGVPERSSTGDVSGFLRLDMLSELEPTLPEISFFQFNDRKITTNKPLKLPVSYDFTNRIFTLQDKNLGIDSFSESYREMRSTVLEELVFLWESYALAKDEELDDEALELKKSLLERFHEDNNA